MKEPWYLLTTLSESNLVKELYQARWGIEMMFRDCKSGGYNLEATRVDSTRFLALVLLITFAYWLATIAGKEFQSNHLVAYLGRSEKTLIIFLITVFFGSGYLVMLGVSP